MRAGGLATLLICSLPIIASFGCRNHSNELLESELRTKEIQYSEMLNEFKQTKMQNEALLRELIALRQGGAYPSVPHQPFPGEPHQPSPIAAEKARPAPISPALASQAYTVQKITLGRFTGGRDDDNVEGDDVLQVVLEPRDEADHVIKAPGMLQVFALEVSPQGNKTLLCSWEIPADRLRAKWRSSLFSRGYDFKLRWKNWPTTEKLRIVARFILPDGRLFETDKDVMVRLTPGAEKLQHTPPVPTPGPKLPTNYPLLPMPKEVPPILPPLGKAHSVQRIQPAATWEPATLENAIQLHRASPVR